MARLSQADRDKGVKYLEQTRNAIVADTKTSLRRSGHLKPLRTNGPWPETLEHIALAEDYIFQMVTNTQ